MTEDEVKYCTNCGNQIKKDDVFCYVCGYRQGAKDVVSKQTVAIKNESKKRKFFTVIVIFVLVACIGTAIFFFLSRNSLRGEWKCKQLETVDDYLADVLSDMVEKGLSSNPETAAIYSLTAGLGADEIIDELSTSLISMFEIDDALRKYTFYFDKDEIQLMSDGEIADKIWLTDGTYVTLEMPYTVDKDQISVDVSMHMSVNENIDLFVTNLDVVFDQDFNRNLEGEFTLEDDNLNIEFDEFELDFIRKEK